MSINTTTSTATTTQSSITTQTSSNKSSNVDEKTNTSFKDELKDVSKSEDSSKTKDSSTVNNKNENNKTSDKADNNQLQSNDNDMNLGYFSINDMNITYNNKQSELDFNQMLTSDISEMMNKSQNTFSYNSKDSLSMSSADADFFLNLTQNDNVNLEGIINQSQNMVNSGADVTEVQQSSQVSKALLDALSNARENNQPLRIDFDSNVSVILKIGKEGAISANFIPGDKAVEQYLRNNIATLKQTFDQNNLPYSDLSYSNRGSKQQKEHRRNNQNN